MKNYVVRDVTGLVEPKETREQRIEIVSEDRLWQIIRSLKDDPSRNIEVYELGKCILDWLGPRRM